MFKRKRLPIKLLSALMICTFALTVFTRGAGSDAAQNVVEAIAKQQITKLDIDVDTGVKEFLNEDVVYKLPETVSDDQDISVIVTMSNETLTESYKLADSNLTLPEYVNSKEGKKVSQKITKAGNKLINMLKSAGVRYTLGNRYDTVISGFEVTIKAGDFGKVNSILSPYADLMVSEEYAPSTYQVVTNEVDVYETGIFDSSSSEYQGDGVVVAVLDTGLDYTHSAFSATNFTTENEAFTLQTVASSIKQTSAAGFTAGLTAEDVYVSSKVPFAYDYADKDPDVFPINSEHGTHVAGVIAGSDDVITGVAPNAQLAIMKVFSDTATGAKDSWIIAALEDCVKLGVDVINMSLGSSCGFTREVDKEQKNLIYDKIREEGISLICAASNDYNATFGSEKNGNLGLTSNPDSGTVGAPATYESALSVASVDGVKTPYLVHGDDIIYFNEATTSDAKQKDFVDAILKTVGGVDEYVFDFEVIPGIGMSSDYPHDGDFYKGKIVLVKRGTTTFEDKVRIALKEKGAAGIIIYNNVSGTISMSVGADIGAVCSIAQDEGEKLAATGGGKIVVSRTNVAGPFMSDFSSWGPTSDLKIKPEITAHGGEILSAVPGQAYDRLSGTSMAAPNQAGAAALIRQYVKYSGVFGEPTNVEVTSIVNQLMMSTADIIYNKNGLPYAVRKQGAGLVNITKSYTTPAYVTTYAEDGTVMDKTKLELGDDKDREGVYEVTFSLNNLTDSPVSYKLGSIVMTEGVSETYTSHSETTVTQDGYLLSPTAPQITEVSGEGTNADGVITVNGKGSVKVTAKIVLSDEDKKYLDKSFEHGMYIEGFITLDGQNGNDVDLNVPMLAFYGDWTEAPIFDEEYYDTHKDEINQGLDVEDKLMPDAYATRVIGGLYSDYIATMGEYYFKQNPAATQIAASKDHIAISNQKSDNNFTVCSIRSINAGLLRNVKEYFITVTEDSTGRVVFTTEGTNQYKSHSGGGSIYPSSIDVELDTLALDLKNNTQYTVELTAYIDYGAHDQQNNVRNTFTFPLFVDFEAPIITDVTYRTEYDVTTKKTQLFADLSIFDNHYSQGIQLGQITEAPEDSEYTFAMKSFGKYMTPVYSTFNSTSVVSIELTDYVSQIKNSAGIDFANGSGEVVLNNNSFIATCYDYAMNSAVYEIRLPDEIISMYFAQDELRLSPNETKDLTEILKVYPSASWVQTLDYKSADESIVTVVNQTVIAKAGGSTTIEATGYDKDGNKISATLPVTVLQPGDEGYNGTYTIPAVNKFVLTGYTTNKAYYSTDPEDREIGFTDGSSDFGASKALSMYPSEAVTLEYVLDSYFSDATKVVFTSGDPSIATVDENGQIIAQKEGSTVIMAQVYFNDAPELYLESVAVAVKDPFKTQGMYLMHYKGLGGTVEIPSDRGITMIYSYAFSNYEWVDKDLEAGDVIDEEDPYLIKQHYIGEDTITKIIIPEGVTQIDEYAFANLTALEEVVLPTTLTRIGKAAFFKCDKLTKINLENVKFINESAFEDSGLSQVNFEKIVAIGNYAFRNAPLSSLVLPKTAQSIGQGAFYNNQYLDSVEFKASKIKVAPYAFALCSNLYQVNVNAAVISSYAFIDCTSLESVTLGKDVAVIGEFAFANTNVSAFNIDSRNQNFTTDLGGGLVFSKDKSVLVLAAPCYKGERNTITLPEECTEIETGAFSGNQLLFKLDAKGVTKIGNYAFALCSNLTEVKLGQVLEVGDFAFTGTSLRATPDITMVDEIGASAFSYTKIQSVNIGSDVVIGDSAFYMCNLLESVTLGDNVTVGEGAFYCPISLYTYENTGTFYTDFYTAYQYEVRDDEGNLIESSSYYRYDLAKGITSILKQLTIGQNANICDFAFAGNAMLKKATVGQGATIGNYAFFNCLALTDIDLSKAVSIGDYAFSGTIAQDYMLKDNEWQFAFDKLYFDGTVYILDYVYTGFAPAFTSLDLSSVQEIGKGAFANNSSLASVNLGKLTKIADMAFANCPRIESITIPETVTEIGAQAFYRNKLTKVELSNAAVVGDYAFALNSLKTVTLAEGATVGNGAFALNHSLTKVNNLAKATVIGQQAFMNTALTEADLTSAEEIGAFAFANSSLEKVTLGESLTTLGENPFYGCEISTFGRNEDLFFNGQVVSTTLVEDYDVSDKVFVKDGVLYQTIATGIELVSYPKQKADASYTVMEGTARIAARAFEGNESLYSVTLPTTLKAVGDKAFYGCTGLGVVTFTSYYAPTLEEEYDQSVLTYNNLPYTGTLGEYVGLGISKFYMWNVTSNFNNFYFGANFVDYIGHVKTNLVMVRPANGINYNTFIHGQYFSATVLGANAATDTTKQVIEMIANLPKNVTLADEAAVVAARAAYDKIPSLEQKALVTNLSTLTDAESTITYLKNRDDQSQDPPVVPDPGKDEGSNEWLVYLFAGITIVYSAVVAFFILKKRNKKQQ